MGTAALVVAGVLTVASIDQQQKAQSAQKKAAKEQRAGQRGRALSERRKQVRQARIARGQAVNTAAISGGEGSILAGATSSATQQSAVNQALISGTEARNEGSFRAQLDASRFSNRAAQFGSVASLASTFATLPAGGGTTTGGAKGANATSTGVKAPRTTFTSSPFGGPF